VDQRPSGAHAVRGHRPYRCNDLRAMRAAWVTRRQDTRTCSNARLVLRRGGVAAARRGKSSDAKAAAARQRRRCGGIGDRGWVGKCSTGHHTRHRCRAQSPVPCGARCSRVASSSSRRPRPALVHAPPLPLGPRQSAAPEWHARGHGATAAAPAPVAATVTDPGPHRRRHHTPPQATALLPSQGARARTGQPTGRGRRR